MKPPEDPLNLQVRLATPDEADTLAALLSAAFVEYAPLYTAAGFAATTPTALQILSRWGEGPVWIARRGSRSLGTVAAVLKGQAVYVRSMAVPPEARGQGVGRLLLEQVEHFAREQGCQRLFLSTTPFLQRAIRLYEQFGFVRTREGPIELHGTPLFTMEKRLQVEIVSSK